MTLEAVLAILKPFAEMASTAGSIGKKTGRVVEWFGHKATHPASDPNLLAVLANLSPNATLSEIALAIGPLFAAEVGDVVVEADNECGGCIPMELLVGADGPRRGGHVAIKAGDGGQRGPGGSITIVGRKTKGGDAR